MSGDADLALLLSTIYLSKKHVKGRKRLQKTVCVLKYQYDVPFQFQFRPYFYGPYSEQLAEAINVLEAVGLVTEVEDELPSGVIQYDYYLTKKGEAVAEDMLSKNVPEKESVSKLKRAVPKISDLETSELVAIAKSVLH